MNSLGIRASSSLKYIPGLDGIRAIAVIAVMLRHYTSPFTPVLNDAGWGWKAYATIANLGWVGVDIFFVLSGYLIAKMLLNNPIDAWNAYSKFVNRRIWRLIPAYVACLLVFSLIALLFVPNSKVLNNSLSLWTMTSNIQSAFVHRTALMDGHFNLVHFWSLAVEWHFYLLLPVLVWIFRSVTLTAIVLIGVAMMTRYLFHQLHLSDNAIYSFTLCRIDALAMGCLLAVVAPKINHKYANLSLIAGALLFVSIMYVISQSAIPYKKLAWMQLFGYSLIALSVAMMMVGIIKADAKSLIIAALERPFMLTIGRASYSLYIWHLVFFPFIANMALDMYGTNLMAFSAAFVMASLLAMLATVFSYHYVESKCYLAQRQSEQTTQRIAQGAHVNKESTL